MRGPADTTTPQPKAGARKFGHPGANPAGSGVTPDRCTVNMYLIGLFWLRGAGTAKTGHDWGDRCRYSHG